MLADKTVMCVCCVVLCRAGYEKVISELGIRSVVAGQRAAAAKAQ
jgi:hypothetical protein